jgi:hypothetical protein
MPPVDTHWGFFDSDVPDPPDVFGMLAQYARRLTSYRGLFEAIQRIEVWHPQAAWFPSDLRGVGGLTYPGTMIVRLVGTYDVPDVLAHELGHVAHLWLRVASNDQAGRDAWHCWRDAGGTVEDWASDFGAYVLGHTQSPYFRHLPTVLSHWRQRAGWIAAGSVVRVDGIWQWTDIERGRVERFVDGRWLAYVDNKWQEEAP